MDLGAYAQIDDLEKVMEDNGIVIPRLRGLRRMRDEFTVTKEEMLESAKYIGLWECQSLCRCNFIPDACCHEYSWRTNRIVEKYMIKNEHHDYVGIRWDNIHGKRRKMFKFELKKAKKRVFKQYEMFNKYVGRPDVLYIHARLGSGNWGGYDCEKLVKGQPWFLDYIEDAFDCTYVDIYAKIKENTDG